jgi:hypothetical protein
MVPSAENYLFSSCLEDPLGRPSPAPRAHWGEGFKASHFNWTVLNSPPLTEGIKGRVISGANLNAFHFGLFG